MNIYFKRRRKRRRKTLSEESNFQNFIKREFIKEIATKNNLSDSDYNDLDDTLRYEIANFKPLAINNINNNNLKPSTNLFSN